MQEFETYKKEFKWLTTTVYTCSLGQEPMYPNRYSFVLQKELNKVEVTQPLELVDIEQQLRMYWFIFVEKFKQTNPSITLRQYLLRRSIWALRTWYTWSMKPCGPSHTNKIQKVEKEFPFKLDIFFLIYGCELHPFNLLSPYQRYILYLRFKEKKSEYEIADLVIKTRMTVRSELKYLINFLRSEVKNGSKNTG